MQYMMWCHKSLFFSLCENNILWRYHIYSVDKTLYFNENVKNVLIQLLLYQFLERSARIGQNERFPP